VSKKEIQADIKIEASPKSIWNILIDVPAYRDWNPFIQREVETQK